MSPSEHAAITGRCLIAADVDKTILEQEESERIEFLRKVAPRLFDAANLGARLAFITGNSMPQLTKRILPWLLDELCRKDGLVWLDQFHFFSNSGGVYFHFPINDHDLASLLSEHPKSQEKIADAAYDLLTFEDDSGNRLVRPRFIDFSYIRRTHIREQDAQRIKTIMEECSKRYFDRVHRRLDEFAKKYDFAKLCHSAVDLETDLELQACKDGSTRNQIVRARSAHLGHR